ncbi:unnamed protein product [Polarella glacialis]|uniref:Uncharacterized protein n=1 Tax=Polarella glacialis TaxID=89957 RepID=A0A813EWJ5_POLGL|nr:unnamed protein product [Polarella glacialis]
MKDVIAQGMFTWARENGALPLLTAVGGTLGALKNDTFIDWFWSSDATIQPLRRLFQRSACSAYLGWGQQFFAIPTEAYKKRPDLANCGGTLFGTLPKRNQQMDLNYLGPIPNKVDQLLKTVEAKMLDIGVPMAERQNEVAPGQHEMSPIYCVWQTDDERLCFVTGLAALAWGRMEYNELVRLSVAHAGNDHRLGAQEAPPAIISLYPGTGFEAHVHNIINGGGGSSSMATKQKAGPGYTAAELIDTKVEDRNRTAPSPFCGNRFEFRAVAHVSEFLERGASLQEAVAATFSECRQKRGLPNLNTTPLAIQGIDGNSKQVQMSMGIFPEDEVAAFAETMYET